MKFDYVVVGAGTAGCVIASRLATRSDARVAVIDAAKFEIPWHHRHLPIAGQFAIDWNKPSRRRRVYWTNTSEPEQSLQGRRIEWPTGKMLGGSSALNGTIYNRGARGVFDRWGESSGARWSYENSLGYFKRSEDFESGESKYHGSGGFMSVTAPTYKEPFYDAFIASAIESGIRENNDFNGESQIGTGYYQFTKRKGLRSGPRNLLCATVSSQNNIRIFDESLVRRVLFEGGTAVGVEVVRNGQVQVISANTEIVLCAGTIRSAQLLQVSGVGPESVLKKAGVSTVYDASGVGLNIGDHLRVPVEYATTSATAAGMRARLQMLGEVLRGKKDGRASTTFCDAGGFVSLRGPSEEANLQFVPHSVSFYHDRPKTIDLEPCLVSSKSRGHLEIVSDDFSVAPRIVTGYLREQQDVDDLICGIELARELAVQLPFRREYKLTEEILPGKTVRTPQELADFVRSHADTCFHITGSCRMGNDEEAVVDGELRVRGVERLRVADASIMPELVTGNTTAATIMIAEQCADMLLAGVSPSDRALPTAGSDR